SYVDHTGVGQEILAIEGYTFSRDGGVGSATTLFFVDSYLTANLSVVDGTWHFLAATYSNSQARFFVDGVELPGPVASSGGSSGSYPADTVVIGNDLEGDRPFVGDLDEVRVLDFAADAAQIAADFQAGPMTDISGTV